MTEWNNQTTPNETPFVRLEHDELPTIIRKYGAVCYPFGERGNLVFASAKEGQRWRKNVSSLKTKSDKLQITFGGLPIGEALLDLGFLISTITMFGSLGAIIVTGNFLENWWTFLASAFSAMGLLGIIMHNLNAEDERDRSTRAAFTYQVFNLHHPMFPKDSPLVEYGTAIFALQNRQSGIDGKQGFEEDLGASSMILDTGESTRHMLEEHEKYLGMASRFAKLWPDADQPTRDAIVEDMATKAESLRAACANYQADADQMAKIDREKQNYLAQQEAEAENIIAKAKAEEVADEYRRIKAQYDF